MVFQDEFSLEKSWVFCEDDGLYVNECNIVVDLVEEKVCKDVKDVLFVEVVYIFGNEVDFLE